MEISLENLFVDIEASHKQPTFRDTTTDFPSK